MKGKKSFFLNCCEWLYQSAVSAGILFVPYAFLQDTLTGISIFSEPEKVFESIAGVICVAQILISRSDKKFRRFWAWPGLLVISGSLILKYTENNILFWCYAGLTIVCIGVSLAVHVLWRFRVSKGLLICVQPAALVVLIVLKKPVPIWCAGVILTTVLLFLVELRAKGRKEVLGLLPFFAAAMFFLCRIPENEKTMDWSRVQKACLVMRENVEMLTVEIENLFGGKSNFAFSGYGGSGKIGGSVFDSNHVQLHITGSGTKNPLYLTGRVYEFYDGNKWQVVSNEALRSGQMDASLSNALEQSIYAEQGKELTSASKISVEYRFIRTKDLFHELNTTDLYGTAPTYKEGFPWTMKFTKSKGFYYTIRFQEVNEKSDEIKALYRQQAWKENAIWDEERSLQEADIYQTDTVLPDNLSRRVYELARVLTKDAENDFDRMTALADYLKGYTYTKTPSACPKGRELTDYFLFESKSGYCGHFATALAVLGRCVGIPTRYVQGFMTTDTGKNHSDVELTGTQAHAWTEFYIEHIGWVRMDATPGYGKTFEDRWEAEKTTGTAQPENFYFQVENFPEKPFETPDIQEGPMEQPVLQKKSAEWYVFAFLKMMAVFFIMGILGAEILRIRNRMRGKTYARADNLEKIQLQLKRVLRLGRLYGFAWSDAETLQAYRERAYTVLDTEEYSFAGACAVYEKIRFGGKSISTAELQKLETYAEMLENDYLAECGRIKHFMYLML